VAGDLLHPIIPELAAQLAGVDYTSSVTVNLLFGATAMPNLLSGFGFLVPRSENRQMVACTFVHNKFPHRVPEGKALLRCFFAADEQQDEVLKLSNEELTNLALAELRDLLGINAQPERVRVARWYRAMAQYAPGHLERVAEIERLRRRLSGLGLAGNYLRGIGVPDCIRAGAEAVTEVIAAVQPRAAGGV
jgi:oxygen-dependent protoporphyrinogen oxidase